MELRQLKEQPVLTKSKTSENLFGRNKLIEQNADNRRKRSNTHLGRRGAVSRNNKTKTSFKAVGIYVTFSKGLSKSLCKREEERDSVALNYENILAQHEQKSAEMLAADKEKCTVTPIPKMSNEMRRIICDLDKVHLIDTDDTINEQMTEDDDDGDIEIMEIKESHKNTSPVRKAFSNRPKWNNFIRKTILPQQNVVASFKLGLSDKKKKHFESEELENSMKLPKLTKTTEKLMLRNSCLNEKLQTMKRCHATGRVFEDSFVRRRAYTAVNYSSSSNNKQHTSPQPKKLHRRSQSCQSYLY